MILTARDKDLLATLCLKVRMLTASQIAATWWPAAPSANANAQRRLRGLVAGGFLHRQSLPAYPLLPLSNPILTWAPGEGPPDYEVVGYQLQHRWEDRQYEPTMVYFASRRAMCQLGGTGTGRLRHADQASHDLHLSQVYLLFRQKKPELARCWVGEEEFAVERLDEKLPDAVIKDSSGAVRLVVEFGGKYDPRRFRAFHEDCRTRGIPYQLW